MGTKNLEVTSEMDEMTDSSDKVSDPDCLGAMFGAEENVYDGSGWTAVHDLVAREPEEDNEHWVEQTAVLYPDADNANKFFEKSKSTWQKCAGTSLAVDDQDSSSLWEFGDAHGAGRSDHADGDAAGRRRLGLSARPCNGVEHDRRNLGMRLQPRARRRRRWPSTSPPTPPSSDGRSASRISSPVASVGSRHGCLWHPGSHGPGPESLTARRSCDRFDHRRRRTATFRPRPRRCRRRRNRLGHRTV